MAREPSLTRDEVRDVDRRAIEQYGLPGIVLMENAGRGAAELLLDQGVSGPVVVCCGGGNNGGDGYVIARHLDLAGVAVRVAAVAPLERLTGDAAVHARVVECSQIPLTLAAEFSGAQWDSLLSGAAWIVDALLGTGMRGEVRSPYADVIDAINRAEARVLAVDLPSGLDCDTGRPLGACVQADVTATFVARKRGFDAPGASEFTGAVHVVGIGAPRVLIDDVLRRRSI